MSLEKKPDPRCSYRSPSGKRCRNTVSVYGKFCDTHYDFGRDYAAAAEIVSNRDRLDTVEGVHSLMARITRALAGGKIRSRDASTLFYGCQTMLQALEHLRDERVRVFQKDEKQAWRSKALADSFHDALNCRTVSPEEEEQEEAGANAQKKKSA